MFLLPTLCGLRAVLTWESEENCPWVSARELLPRILLRRPLSRLAVLSGPLQVAHASRDFTAGDFRAAAPIPPQILLSTLPGVWEKHARKFRNFFLRCPIRTCREKANWTGRTGCVRSCALIHPPLALLTFSRGTAHFARVSPEISNLQESSVSTRLSVDGLCNLYRAHFPVLEEGSPEGRCLPP